MMSSFDRGGRISRFADAGGVDGVATSAYAYDQAHRLTGLVHAQGATELVPYMFRYGQGSRIDQINGLAGQNERSKTQTVREMGKVGGSGCLVAASRLGPGIPH